MNLCFLCRKENVEMRLYPCNHPFCYSCCLKMSRCKLCCQKIEYRVFMNGNNEILEQCDWKSICRNKKLTEEFMNIFWEYLDWNLVSTYQTISESFIEKHARLVNWKAISYHQKLSIEFIKKHINKLDRNAIEKQGGKEIRDLCKRLFH